MTDQIDICEFTTSATTYANQGALGEYIKHKVAPVCKFEK